MAYYSKYTGNEIDSILDKANKLPSALGTNNQVLGIDGVNIGWITLPTKVAEAIHADSATLATSADSATVLTTARTIQTDLASTSAASFNGSANITPGVTGILPIANGGTGGTTQASAITSLGVYPIGSILCMSTNTNPGTSVGGTWTLIDKEFKSQTLSVATSDCTLNTTNCTSVDIINGLLDGHCITMNLSWTNKVAIEDTTLDMFTLPLAKMGVTSLTHNHQFSMFSDGGNVLLSISITTAGLVRTLDVIKKNSTASTCPAATGLTNHVFTFPVVYTAMIDSFCDKFYFKRTA